MLDLHIFWPLKLLLSFKNLQYIFRVHDIKTASDILKAFTKGTWHALEGYRFDKLTL